MRRRWEKLDDEQRAIADELVRRALALREASDGELSIREALDLAADAIQRRTESIRFHNCGTAECGIGCVMPDGR